MATVDQNQVEKNDSVVIRENLNLFQPIPKNLTFTECREIKLVSSPADDDLAQIYTFTHHKVDYGLIRTDDFSLSAVLLFKKADGTALANDRHITIYPKPLSISLWKEVSLSINDELASNNTNHHSLIAWLRHLLFEMPDTSKPIEAITLGQRDTEGQFDTITNLSTGTVDGNVTDKGGHARLTHIFGSIAAGGYYVNDKLDITLFNGYGKKCFIPSSYQFKIEFQRNPKTKYIKGNADHAAAHDVRISKFKLSYKMYRPNEQFANAINDGMMYKGEEAKYFVSNFRLVVKHATNGGQNLSFYDIFNGGLPSRVFIVVMTLARYNGAHTLNQYRFNLPEFTYCCARTNMKIIQEYESRQEAYVQLRKNLNRNNSEMPISYEQFTAEYGMISFDTSPNQDSYTSVLSDDNNGTFGFEINLTAALGADSVFLFFGEFRNQLNLSYKTPLYYTLKH